MKKAVRIFQVLIGVWVVLLIIVGTILKLQPAIIGLAGGGGALVGVLLLRRYAQNNMVQPGDDPPLVERLRAICSSLGRPDLQPVVVTGAGISYLRLQGEQLLVSPRLGAALDDAELTAVVLRNLNSTRDLVRQSYYWYFGPWLVAFVLLGLVSLYFRMPLVGLLLPLAVIWFVAANRMPRIHAWLARPQLRAFVQAGGDSVALARAIHKLYPESVALMPKQYSGVTAQARGNLQVLAQLAGDRHPELHGMTAIDYAFPGGKRPWSGARILLFLALGWFVLLMLSVIIAVSLGSD